MIIYDTWTNIKNLVDTNNLPINYFESDNLYKISILYEQNTYTLELWINTDNIDGIDVTQNNIDRLDFENNYKTDAKGINNLSLTPNLGSETIEISSQVKQTYKCIKIDINADEQEFDLGSTYTEFTIIVTGLKNVIIKLNDTNNDEIPLSGGQNIRDIIGADAFEVNKIYYRTTQSGDESQILLWAIK